MSYYAVVETNLKTNSWVAEYTEHVPKLIVEYGGEYLAMTPDVTVVEGDEEVPHVMVIARFPTKQHFLDFYESEGYSPYKKARQDGAECNLKLIAGLDS